MRHCFLHIGPQKTGSSSIQHFLFENRELWAEAGFYVPRARRNNIKGNHAQLAEDFASNCGPRDSALAAELREQELPETVIISSEDYAAFIMKPHFLIWLQSYFADLSYGLTIITYIRPQIALINSDYSQRAKSLNVVPTFDNFLSLWLAKPEVHSHGVKFANLISNTTIESVFIPFTTELSRNGLCADFALRVGLPSSVLARSQSVEVTNVSPGPKTIAALRIISESTREAVQGADRRRVGLLARRLRDMMDLKGWDSTRFDGLSIEQKAKVIDGFAKQNSEFAATVWNKNWCDIFGGDEDSIRLKPRNIFDPAEANLSERKEFEDFCRDSAEFVIDFLKRP